MSEKQYLNLAQRIINDGEWITNERTGKRCLTVINADFEYNVGKGEFPLITTRKSYWKSAIAELLGYIRGYDNAADFRKLGTKTWDANANENEAWLNNLNRKGEDDIGRIYGVQGRDWINSDRVHFDQFKKVYTNLKNGIDDRGEIVTFWNAGEFGLGCLRPCMHTHTFSLIGDTLHLTSYQRSIDVPLGLNFNQVQVYALLAIMAKITGHKAGIAYHKMINCHIYEDQLELMRDVQLKREPFPSPKFSFHEEVKTLKDLESWVGTDHFEVSEYESHPAIKYPFSV